MTLAAADRTADTWNALLVRLGVGKPTAAAWAPVCADELRRSKFSAGDRDLIAFLPQILHESSMLEKMQENLNYKTAERLCEIWPSRFPTVESARPYVRQPELLANKVYGGRMGNTAPGDGWLYRGRSPIGITGKDNYIMVGDLMGQDLLNMPHLLEQPRFAMEACVKWWEGKVPDSALADTVRVSRIVNGGTIGIKERIHLAQIIEKEFARV